MVEGLERLNDPEAYKDSDVQTSIVKVKGESLRPRAVSVTYANHYFAFSSISFVLLGYSRYLRKCFNQSGLQSPGQCIPECYS